MSQAATWSVPTTGPSTPAAYATRDDDSFDALLSNHKGVSRPAYAVAGTIWVDDSVAGTNSVYYYDGADDILIGTVSTASNTWTPVIRVASEAEGDILFRNATTWVRLAKGTARQVIQQNSALTAPEWVASPQSVLTAKGDLLVASAANTLARKGVGTALQVLGTNSTPDDLQWMASLQSLMTAQGDIVYASGANTPARLAKGTALQVLRMNAGETAPEWAALSTAGNVYYGTLTRNLSTASGSVDYTDAGFTPKFGLFYSVSTNGYGLGFDNGSIKFFDNGFYTTRSVALIETTGQATGYVSAWLSNGFTFAWTRVVSENVICTVHYVLFG